MPRHSKAHPPHCKKCGGHHWGFVACDEKEAYAARERENDLRRTPHTVRVPRADGLKDWGDRLDTVTRLGGQSYGRSERAVPLQTGSIKHPDWQPPE